LPSFALVGVVQDRKEYAINTAGSVGRKLISTFMECITEHYTYRTWLCQYSYTVHFTDLEKANFEKIPEMFFQKLREKIPESIEYVCQQYIKRYQVSAGEIAFPLTKQELEDPKLLVQKYLEFQTYREEIKEKFK
jgi:uncharacterized protein YnzC (UPF0291/DUF896 family)